MVNFAVKEQGLQAQLLGHVVRKEVPQLELMKDNLVVTIAKNKKTLVRTPTSNKINNVITTKVITTNLRKKYVLSVGMRFLWFYYKKIQWIWKM